MTTHRSRTLLLAAAAVVALIGGAAAQRIDPASLLAPPADSWLTYHGDYSGRRHSALAQITPSNVHQLTLAWAFQTGQTQAIKASPILANGVLYITAPDNLWALDARSARQLWHYTYAKNDGFHIGHRGVAVYQDLVYLTTPDAHLVALDARDGKEKWDVVLADAKKVHCFAPVSGSKDCSMPGRLSKSPETPTSR
jgi:alcohol dehydrogenase (cytochrome c)